MKDLPTYGDGIGDAIQSAYASTTSANIDLVIEWGGKTYTWWGHFDYKWQETEVYNDDDDVTEDVEEIINEIAIYYLETPNKQGNTKLNELLDNVIYEG